MDYLSAPLQLKAIDDAGTFEGFASTFDGEPDLQGDIVSKGAFTNSLRTAKNVAMLWSHQVETPIGTWKAIHETDAGLHVAGALTLGTNKGREVHALMRDGAVQGLSVGIQVKNSTFDRAKAARVIKEAVLHEISLTALPANQDARILAVKQAFRDGVTPAPQDIERILRDAGFSRKYAKAFISGGISALKPRDASKGLEQLLTSIQGATKAWATK